MQDMSPLAESRRDDGERIGEGGRLDRLMRSGLLDTQAEDVFDRGVRLATKLLGTRVALLSLVDRDRQFFKAQHGLPEPHSQRRETPLTHSFCKHVVETGDVLMIDDARHHPLVSENPAIRDFDVIAYLGVPIVTADGYVLGSFCATDPQPRTWTGDDVETLQTIAKGVESEIRLRIEVDERRALQEKADTDRARLALVLETTADGIVTIDRRLAVIYANRGARSLLATRGELDGRPLWDVFPKAADGQLEAMVDRALSTGEAAEETAFCAGLGRWLEARAVPVGEEVTLFFRDVSARQRALESRQMLVRELHHRIKNLFAIVRGMISMAARGASDPSEMAEALQGRLIALARAHDLIRPALSVNEESDYQEIFLGELVRILVEPYRRQGAGSLTITGPDLNLGVNSTTHVALFIHELTTNANKYGSLSRGGGALSIEWAIEGDVVDFRWSETGGPEMCGAPVGHGFGCKLVKLCIETQLEGDLSIRWPVSGMKLDARIPLRVLAR
ncbi:GAF domain-containing protein [Jiella avicenniae]|uniref:Blue-light-activated histidine kinase n=1 Tax=Jiella avicenniae TaxID=2907202 RepID=A0A9X1T3U4_9HYPH|nr:GAF domain-containing protein [Jiella avicenniae]MCE7027986.1 GAF domain-containing protein [Jiella avicenniae]